MADERRVILTFDEDAHTYTMGGIAYASVTSFIASFATEVDPKALVTSKRQDWAKLETCVYNNKTDQEIIDEWARKRDEAADMGKRMHKMIENDIIAEMKDPTSNREALNPDFPVEMKAYKKFRRDHPHWAPFAIETAVFDEDLGICGTFDAIFYDKENRTYVLLDWKRCEKLSSGYGDQKFLHPILEELACGNTTKYFLQLCAYKWCIDKKCNGINYEVHVVSGEKLTSYVPRVSGCSGRLDKCCIINLHPNMKGHYQKLAVDDNFIKTYGFPFLKSQESSTEPPKKKKRGNVGASSQI